jgi:hypothetical protein
MMKNNKVKNQRKAKKNTARVGRSLASHPPAIVVQSTRSFVIRCTASASINGYQVLFNDLGGLLGVVCRTATTSYYLSSLTRLRRIRIWGPVATAGTPVQVAWTWTNMSEDFETPPVTKSDTSVSFDHPAYLSIVPPRSSLSAKWHGSNITDAIGVLNCPAGSTLDFVIDWVLCDGPDVAPIAGPSLIAGTPGQIYHHPFSNVVPQNLNVL